MKRITNAATIGICIGLLAYLNNIARTEEVFGANEPQAPQAAVQQAGQDTSVPSAQPADAAPDRQPGIAERNFFGKSKQSQDWCAIHPAICQDPNNPLNPNYCSLHPEDWSHCSDPTDPANSDYCNYNPAACGGIPLPDSVR